MTETIEGTPFSEADDGLHELSGFYDNETFWFSFLVLLAQRPGRPLVYDTNSLMHYDSPTTCGTECPGGHDSLTHPALTTEFEVE